MSFSRSHEMNSCRNWFGRLAARCCMDEDVIQVTLDRMSEDGEPVGVDDAGRNIRVRDGEGGGTYRVVVIKTINGRYRGRIRAMKDQETGWGPVHSRRGLSDGSSTTY